MPFTGRNHHLAHPEEGTPTERLTAHVLRLQYRFRRRMDPDPNHHHNDYSQRANAPPPPGRLILHPIPSLATAALVVALRPHTDDAYNPA